MKKKLNKWLIIFFTCMIAFTIISRAVDNLCIIKVETDYAGTKELAKSLEASGELQGKDEVLINSAEGLLVAKVIVEVGEEVKSGELLYQIDVEDIQKLISQKKDEIRNLELQSEEAAKQNESEQQRSNLNYMHLVENYEAAILNKTRALEAIRYDIDQIWQKQEMLRKELSAEQQEYESLAGEDTEDKEEKEGIIEELEQQLNILVSEVSEKENLYEQTQDEHDSMIRTARQELEKADVDIVIQGTGVQQNEILINQKQQELSVLYNLRKNPDITSPVDGIVKELFVAAGTRTVNGADMVLLNKNTGLEVAAVFTQEGKELLHEGLMVNVETLQHGQEYNSSFPVSSVRIVDQTSQAIEIRVDIPNSDLMIGSNVSVNFTTGAKKYPLVIERDALHLDAEDKYYVFVLKSRETLLGEEWKAVKREVRVIDKNEEYAAIEGVLSTEEIIIESSRYVENGSRVKKAENEKKQY